MGWFVYMIETKCGALYTGITTDPERRFLQHQGVQAGGAKYFRGRQAKALVYIESHVDRRAASKREYALKKLAREDKLALVDTYKAKLKG